MQLFVTAQVGAIYLLGLAAGLGLAGASAVAAPAMSVDASAIPAQIERIYREESGRILASLIRLLGDFDAAEDARQDAFRAALDRWPADGIPANPRAWLISTGRFKAIDAQRRRQRSCWGGSWSRSFPLSPRPRAFWR